MNNEVRPHSADQHVGWSSSLAVPLLVTSCLFALRLPITDLPLWDDGTLYLHGHLLLQGHWSVLNLNWQPVLCLLTVPLDLLFPAAPIIGFFVFQYLGHVAVAIGTWSILRALNFERREAVWLTVAWCLSIHVLCAIADFPTLHLYHAGIPLCVGAYCVRRTPISWPMAAALILLSVGVRNESILPLSLFTLAGALRRRSAGLPTGDWRWRGALPVFIALALVAVPMSLDSSNFRGGRLAAAFRQQFFSYAVGTSQYDAVLPASHDGNIRALEQAFGKDAQQENLLGLVTRNPVAFGRFMHSNLQVALRGDIFGGQHRLLGATSCGIFALGLVALLAHGIWRKDPFALCLLLAVLAKLPLYLVTVPRFYYAADSLLIGSLAVWKLVLPTQGARVARFIAGGLALLALISIGDGPHRNLRERIHMQRARFIREAVQKHHLQGALLAEQFGPFSLTFGSRELRGSEALQVAQLIGSELYSSGRERFDAVLVEDGSPLRADIKRWVDRQTPVESSGPFHLLRQTANVVAPSPLAPADVAVWVTDDFGSTEDLVGGVDHDSSLDRQLVVKWNYPAMKIPPERVARARVGVQLEDGADYEVLGEVEGIQSFLEWKPGHLQVDPPHRGGPEFGRRYRFQVELFSREPEMHLTAATTREALLLLPVTTVHDDERGGEDLSGREDTDSPDARALLIRWTLDDKEIDFDRVEGVHVYVRVDGAEDPLMLGQISADQPPELLWRSGTPLLAPAFQAGPQFGHAYQFYVYLLTRGEERVPSPPFANAAEVQFTAPR